MRVDPGQFKQDAKDKFQDKSFVSIWENTPSIDKDGDEVINVGLSKGITLMEACELPAEIDGVKIVYYFAGEIRLMTTKYYDPLIGGVSIGAVDVTAGTYSGVVYDKDTDEPYLLTNEHVVSNVTNTDPAHPPLEWPILQPGFIDGGKKPAAGYLYKVGGLKRKALRNEPCNIDAALLCADRDVDKYEFWGLGQVEEKEYVDALPGDKVIKVGRTTHVTTNTISATGVSVNIAGLGWGNPVTVENVMQTHSAFVQGEIPEAGYGSRTRWNRWG